MKRGKRRFELAYQIDTVKPAEDRATDGIFPLVTDVDAMFRLPRAPTLLGARGSCRVEIPEFLPSPQRRFEYV